MDEEENEVNHGEEIDCLIQLSSECTNCQMSAPRGASSGHVFSFVLFPSSFYPLGLKHELAANCASERILSQDVIGFVDYVLVPSVNGEQENRVQKGNGYFQVPPHTPVIFGEAGGRTLFR